MKKPLQFWNQCIGEIRDYFSSLRGKYTLIGLSYLLLISAAEAITTLVDPQLGMLLHSLVLMLLLVHGSLVHRELFRRFLILLSIAPLIRILSLSLPLQKLNLPVIYWYMIIGVLLFVAAFIAGRMTNLGGNRIGWSWRAWPIQILAGLSGFGLGYIEFLILKPGPLAASVTWIDVLMASFILLVFTGVLEEFIFRGLMQSAAMQIMGRYGLVYIAVLFAVLHLGYHSLIDLLFVLGVGLIFGWWVWKTNSLLGASLSHGIANISLYVIFPLIISAGSLPVASIQIPAAQTMAPISGTISHTNATGTADATLLPPVILIDNENPGFVYTGTNLWLDTTDGYDGNFRWAYAAQSIPDIVVTWVPAISHCGRFQVEAFIPSGGGLTESAFYAINHRQGRTTIRVDQAVNSGAWVTLGIFEFEVGFPSNIQLSNRTEEDPKLLRWVAFDAIRWILIDPCRPTGTDPLSD
jgi:membrane protease YdiL (CAAX protease family)